MNRTLSVWASKDPIVQLVPQFGGSYNVWNYVLHQWQTIHTICLDDVLEIYKRLFQKVISSSLVGAVAYLVQCLAQCGQTCKENLGHGYL